MMEQRTPEWHRARQGIPTASNFAKIMMGHKTKTRQDYLCRLLMERILGRSLEENVKTKWMQHGIATEEEAVAEFCATQNLAVKPCGFILEPENGRYGCSPDRLIRDQDAILEIKCPAPWTHCRYLIYGPGDDYEAQVQGQIMITQSEAAYFMSYFPGLSSVNLKFMRDEKYIKNLKTELDNFCDDLDQKFEYISKTGADVFDIPRALGVLSVLMPEGDYDG